MSDNRKLYFIVVAAGGGTRFGGDIPKQFRLLGDKIVLRHSIDTFMQFCKRYDIEGQLIVVLSPAGRNFWEENIAAYYKDVIIAEGGSTRARSVASALSMIGETGREDVILVHDGARPLMTSALLERLLSIVGPNEPAVVPAVAPTDSLMEKLDNGNAVPVNRSQYLAVQTPQVFDARALKAAYERAADAIDFMTDDASVFHFVTGKPIRYVAGEDTNIKITKPSDLPLAEYILNKCFH